LTDRNSSRRKTGVDSPAPQIAASNAGNQNSLLNFSAPTEFVELPSRGALYSSGHPLHNKETLEIKYMTAKEEDILTSQSLLRKGLAIDRLLESVIIDKNIDPKSLLVGDRNAILFAIRVTGYGADYPANVNCGSCGFNHDHNFNLENYKDGYKFLDEEKSEFEFSENGTFFVKLPKSGITVELRPLTGTDEDVLAKSSEMKSKQRLAESGLTDMFRVMIVSANNIVDRSQISEFIDNMPALDSRYLRAAYQNVVPNVEFSEAVECPECGELTETEVPFTAQFFWPDQ
tara:strand:- start:2525 stop:3388 length:864 start_codon:yes stop_codon:yes gene_type:complete